MWYHEGAPELLAARYWVAGYSIPRARERLRQEKEEASRPGPEKAARRQELNKKLRVRGRGREGRREGGAGLESLEGSILSIR